MDDALLIVGYVAAALNAGWMLMLSVAMYRLTRFPIFEDYEPSEPEAWPPVSAVIPACNEAGKIEAALQSLLAQDYPDLEIVVVDDRSTDGTTEIVERLGREEERITPVHITELPDGWLGKVHALHVGTAEASGEWLLYADADVHYGPDSLRRTMAFVVEGELDHLGLVPDIITASFPQEILTQAFGTLLAMVVPTHRVSDPDSPHFFGVGAFNLVRRSVFEKTEGFEWLRMEIADDMGLAYLLHRHGARSWAGRAWETLSVAWYGGAWDMIGGLEKNLFAAMGRYSYLRSIGIALIASCFLVSPFVALGFPALYGWPTGVATLVMLMVFGLVGWRAGAGPPLALACFPLGLAMMVVALLRSAASYRRNGGAVWRGTTYPIEELREHRRVELG